MLPDTVQTHCQPLIKHIMNRQEDLIVILDSDRPVMMNRASQEFFGVDTGEQFIREFGALENRFVPHDAYFHAGKRGEFPHWTDAILALDPTDRNVSMINAQIHPHAFAVEIAIIAEGLILICFRDISTELIKRIMVENDTNLDKASGAFAKTYFVHTSKSFIDAATFNNKQIVITIMALEGDDDDMIKEAVSVIKLRTRQDDMLVRWGEQSLALVYLTDSDKHLNSKLTDTLQSLPMLGSYRIATTLQKPGDSIDAMTARCETALREADPRSVLLV